MGSITTAAIKLDISSSAASMAVKRLEEQLGVALFVRSTRKFDCHLKESSICRWQSGTDTLQQGLALVTEQKQSIHGELRMAMSSEMGRNLCVNCNKVQRENPELSLRLHERQSGGLHRDGVDVALRP